MTVAEGETLSKCSNELRVPSPLDNGVTETLEPSHFSARYRAPRVSEESPSDELGRQTATSSPVSYFDLSSNHAKYEKGVESEGKSIARVGSLDRSQKREDNLVRATSRLYDQEIASEIGIRPMQKRFSRSSTFFEDPTDPRAVLEDTLLEPLSDNSIQSSIGSLSEQLHSNGSTPDIGPARMSFVGLQRAQTTFNSEQTAKPLHTSFNDHRPLYPVPTMPPDNLYQIMPDIDHLEYVAIKSSTSHWALNSEPLSMPATEPFISQATQLAPEILHQIYYNLGPVDFNAARHTCQNWFVNSLERSLLEAMLKRGGWFSSIREDIVANHVTTGRVRIKTNDEWLMSKYISRECALGPDWTGNGLTDDRGHPPYLKTKSPKTKTSFFLSSEIDFTEIAVHHPEVKLPGLIFTVSSCGGFLMVANGCLIYVYELNRGTNAQELKSEFHAGKLSPVTSIICPRQVLACSMDTSSHRYAIAVLMDGRMGLVCDIASRNLAHETKSHKRPERASSPISHSNVPFKALRIDRVSLNSSSVYTNTRSSTLPAFVFSGIATTDTNKSCSRAMRQKSYGELAQPNQISQAPTPLLPLGSHFSNVKSGTAIPIENGLRSIYRDLCSDDDPPRSVAICPQRRCVAFGCSGGIELHWVDALTGQDLNRWFPLTAPSDYLFFLPPRRSVDSAKKLRLISSAARPGERSAMGDHSFGTKSKNSPFWNQMNWSSVQISRDESNGIISRIRRENTAKPSSDWRDYSDHYRAVPLSDGHHILFTDPATGLLCLGSDAPVGGPTKLLRKIWFKGPSDDPSPVAYTCGADLKRGARVVAAFGSGYQQSVWVFSVPSDVFNTSIDDTVRGTQWSRSKSDIETGKVPWIRWWPDSSVQEWLHGVQNPVPGIIPRSFWPLEIRGQKIGTCPGLTGLAIHSQPDMIVWAFSKEGIARVWQLDCGKEYHFEKKVVLRDGTIRGMDQDGDMEMLDAYPSTLSPCLLRSSESTQYESADGVLPQTDGENHNSYDGSASLDSSIVMPASYHDGVSSIDSSSRIHRTESEGEVLMDNLPGVYSAENEDSNESFEGITIGAQTGEVLYLTNRWSGRIYRHRLAGIGKDFVEELTGIARIDIEIR